MRSQDAYAGLYRDETSALTLLATALEKLTQLTSLDASQQHLQADLQRAYYLIEEVARSLLAYGERMDVDPARLQAVEDRLDEIARLQKYGPTIPAILQYHEKLQREHQGWERHGERLSELTTAWTRPPGAQVACHHPVRQAPAGAERLQQAVQQELQN